MRVHRLIAILLLVESRGKIKAKDLALALETSVRSIYRDIDVLAEAGIPMTTTSGPNGGISLMEGYTVNLRQLNGDEVINLYLSGLGFYPGAQNESGLKLKNALLKLEKSLPAPYQEDIRKARSAFLFDDTPWWSERPALPCLESLRAALWRSYKIKVIYRKVNGELSCRKLQPYGLVVKQGDWYLVGFCETAGELRTFKCERITSVEGLEEEYTIPEDFSLEAFWGSREKIFRQNRRAEEFYPVLIKMRKPHPELISKLEVMKTLVKRNDHILTVNMYSYEQACDKVMTLPADIEVLEPVMLREYIKEKILLLQKVYF
ncbi:transcriptional regulator [Paenibacillus sp. PK3_47]|uniref:helix-turn-helix transcriptional regulator n=1 Tax=Paenibacillus sp. PK3_47 TaxID=2072642 RepID=UPI00201D8AA3|nr:WYL domain-containing protein [Paenibacillus sp. PK3_47]UQZ37094.1 transcriptional regulator [Paenibacillus sp. PK3_47]